MVACLIFPSDQTSEPSLEHPLRASKNNPTTPYFLTFYCFKKHLAMIYTNFLNMLAIQGIPH